MSGVTHEKTSMEGLREREQGVQPWKGTLARPTVDPIRLVVLGVFPSAKYRTKNPEGKPLGALFGNEHG